MSTSRATVKELRQDPRREKEYRNKKRKRGKKLVRSSSPARFQREHFLSACLFDRNDGSLRWKSLFFYRCTDGILFAPLKSQGVDSRLNYIREKTVATAPPPCSPKSIYVLASLVRQPSIQMVSDVALRHRTELEIQPLCDSAFADIKSKVSQSNVVGEVFSWVTAM